MLERGTGTPRTAFEESSRMTTPRLITPQELYQTGEPPGAEGLGPDVIVSPDARRTDRLPPRQVRTRKWPVLDAGEPPARSLAEWTFEVSGLIQRLRHWSWEEFQALPRVKVFADMHCVTRWSRLGNLWEGVSTRAILERTGVDPQARYVLVKAEEGWTTNLPLAHFAAEDALFADRHDGRPLPHEHGGPLRLVVPRLYSWKSAKWARGIELLARDRAGFWEQGGYHMRGDPWLEERFR
jgi:DMSO/TMAO reductase YedYZ molybdopterin-dependent catalytic subunit